MITLDKKYVFHIPLYKYTNNKLIPIDIENIVDDLIKQLNENGYDSFYITKGKGYYKSKCFDEILITIFTTSKQNPELAENIFRKWFQENNNILKQEAFAYELNNTLLIEELTIPHTK